MRDIENMTGPQIAKLVGKAGAAFDTIRLKYQPQDDIVTALLTHYYSSAYRQPGTPADAVMFIAPYGAGKTVTGERLLQEISKDADEGTTPLLLVETSEVATVDSLPTSLLKAMNQPRPDAGKPERRWERATAKMEELGVKSIFFDEFDRASRRPTMSGPMARTIRKKIMDPGLATVIFTGTADAETVLKSAQCVHQRLNDHIELAPLNMLRGGDAAILAAFLADLDTALVHPDMLAGRSQLDDPMIVRNLCDASAGILRVIMKTLRVSMQFAVQRGADVIEYGDLFDAAELICLRGGYTTTNPFGVAKRDGE